MNRTVIHYCDSSVLGGTERALLQLVGGLDRDRWRCVLLHHSSPAIEPMVDEARALGAETISVPRPSGALAPGSLLDIARAIRARAPQVVHAHQSWPLSCRHGILAAGLARVPAVVSTLQLFVELPRRPGIAVRFRALQTVVDRFICVSRHLAHRLSERFGIGDGKLTIVHNAVAPHAYDDRDGVRWATRRALGVDDAPLVVSVARLDAQKDLATLIDAAHAVPNATFLVAGEGSARQALEHRAAALRLGDRFRLLGYRHDVPDLLAAADVFILPSVNEGLPIAMLEAMSAGTPVIATAIGGIDEAISDGQSGLLVPPGDSSALARAIERMMGDRALAGRLSGNARRHVEAEHSVVQMVARVESVYEEVLERRRPRDAA